MIIISLVVVVPALRDGTARFSMSFTIIVGLCYACAGYLLRRGRKSGGFVGFAASGLFLLLIIVGTRGQLSIPLMLHSLVFTAFVLALRSLDKSEPFQHSPEVDRAVHRGLTER